MKKTLVFMCGILLIFAAGCGTIRGKDSSNNVTILTAGLVATPTDANDPYKKWIKDNYNLNVTLIASSSFSTQALLKFSDKVPPEVVSFNDVTGFNRIFNQGVLLSDWTPYLDKMPNIKRIIEKEDADRPGKDSIAKLMMTSDGKLNGLWMTPNPPTWSLKIREDWAASFRQTPGNEDWTPDSPEALLKFARWIKSDNPGGGPGEGRAYGFSSVGFGIHLGTLSQWAALMYGAVHVLPWGVYVNDDNEADFGILDGNHKKTLDFIRTLVREELIEPNWYVQSEADWINTKKGRIGIEWYPGVLSAETQKYQDSRGVDSTNWWKTYPVPKDPDSKYGGYQSSDGFLGKIITVSAIAANDAAKMDKICKLINDVAFYMDDEKDGAEKYVRTAAYDALCWGIGVEESIETKPITGTDQTYLYTKEGTKPYRETYPGARDWGVWFSANKDGIIAGETQEISDVSRKVIEHDAVTATYRRRLQLGGVLRLDADKINELTSMTYTFEYNYVTEKFGGKTAEQFYNEFKSAWIAQGGTQLMAEADRQFLRLGFKV